MLDLDRSTSHQLFTLDNPHRIVIDLPDTVASSSIQLPVPKGTVRSVRTGLQSGGKLRVVLDLDSAPQVASFPLGPDGEFGHRVVVDLARGGNRTSSQPTARREAEISYRDVVIAIDAGHGGKDPGAAGHGVREKDVVLSIAQRLAALFEDQRGFRPVLIRDNDSFVELGDRVRLAHDVKADLFISIHADANPDQSVAGAAIYSISTGKAASESARMLANREGSVELLGDLNLGSLRSDIAKTVLDLQQSISISKSLYAGEAVLNRLEQVTTVRKHSVLQGPFAVLTAPDIPSLLVETAFLTNRREASNLSNPTYQQAMATALHAGIVDFFREYSPPESYIAHNPPPQNTGPLQHVISRGETLSQIAERYRVSLRELRRSNQINGDVIRIGQVLTIPTTG